MDDQMAAGRVTNNDIDRRVGHLEDVQGQHGDRLHELGNELQVVKLQVEHSQALMRAKFEQVIASTDSTSSKLDRLIERMDRENRGFIELEGSPVGRMVKVELDELKTGRKDNRARIERLELRLAQATAIIGILIFVATILAPIFQGWLGVPQ